jgi:hypothetical protein
MARTIFGVAIACALIGVSLAVATAIRETSSMDAIRDRIPFVAQDGAHNEEQAAALLPGAVVLYDVPRMETTCPVLGAVESGRRFRVIERRGDWTLLTAEGSGMVWALSRSLGVADEGRLAYPLIAFADLPSRCSTVAGVADQGERYATRCRYGAWVMVDIRGRTVWVYDRTQQLGSQEC